MGWREDTKAHISRVQYYISRCRGELKDRSAYHDCTKLVNPEAEIFEEYTEKLKGSTYGSDEYKQFLVEMKPALDHHYESFRHHPEHFENGIKDMNLIDMVEMLCDWKAASERHDDGDIYKSIELNQKRFNYDDDVKSILVNTAKFLDSWL